MWCVPKLTPEFKERMDDILALYTEPLPPGEEVHCFDETPKQLLATPRGAAPAAPGRARRLDYEYERRGTRNLFVAVAPFTGTRTVRMTEHRTEPETVAFLWNYCMRQQASRIHLILDNLNTHKEEAIRRELGPARATRFFRKVQLHFTPAHASWLNLAELEINCCKAQGLKQRLPDDTHLRASIRGIVRERNARRARLQWTLIIRARATENVSAVVCKELNRGGTGESAPEKHCGHLQRFQVNRPIYCPTRLYAGCILSTRSVHHGTYVDPFPIQDPSSLRPEVLAFEPQ